MNQDWQEKRIKRLFDEMRQDDERLAPPFTTIGKAALSRQTGSSRRIVRRLAFAGVIVILLGGSALFVMMRLSKHSSPVDVAVTSPAPPNEDKDRDTPPPAKVEAGPVRDTPSPVGRRPRHERRVADALVSQWRSPTDFLLDVPGSRLLRTVPSLGRPANLKANVPDLNN